MWEEHLRAQVPLKVPASVLGLNQGDEDGSFHLSVGISKEKGGSKTAKTGVTRPFCSSPQPQKTFVPPQRSLSDFPPYARVAVQLERTNSRCCSADTLENINTFSFLQTSTSYLATQKWDFYIRLWQKKTTVKNILIPLISWYGIWN